MRSIENNCNCTQSQVKKQRTHVNTWFLCQTRWVRIDRLWRRCLTAHGRRCIWNCRWRRSCRHRCHNSCNRCQEQRAGCSGALAHETKAENMMSRKKRQDKGSHRRALRLDVCVIWNHFIFTHIRVQVTSRKNVMLNINLIYVSFIDCVQHFGPLCCFKVLNK